MAFIGPPSIQPAGIQAAPVLMPTPHGLGTGPPPTVKLSSPIPTELFAPFGYIGPAMNTLRNFPAIYQQHNQQSPIILGPTGPLGSLFAEPPIELARRVSFRGQEWVSNIRQMLTDLGKRARPYQVGE